MRVRPDEVPCEVVLVAPSLGDEEGVVEKGLEEDKGDDEGGVLGEPGDRLAGHAESDGVVLILREGDREVSQRASVRAERKKQDITTMSVGLKDQPMLSSATLVL